MVLSTMSCGKEFQLLTTLREKKNFLESSLQCLLYSFRLCPLVCWLDSVSWKKVSLSTFSFPDRILYVSMRSPLILRLFSVVSPKMCSLSRYFLPFIPFTQFVALFCTFSSTSSSLEKCGFQLCTQYSRWGLMNVL